eukprot:TRINITY_DN7279_c0_g1_i2.p1 TRINITY_DN7279_c0_g1~~TRINITY_DN7279_c0_g1_i2.p1  ORF type:complete len:215 (-),score=79.36 TRINITY_DN7279_c0_g1_i2:637-1236(-)
MDIDKELANIDEMLRLDEENRRGKSVGCKDLYGHDDIVETKFQELLDFIQEKRFCIERKHEKILEEREELRRQNEEQHEVLMQLTLEKDRDQRELNQLNIKLENIEEQLRSSQAREDGMLENIPKLKTLLQMYKHMTRMTLDEKARTSQVKGFIINERKDDVNTFAFDMADPNTTDQFVRNYLWDLISAGANPVWDNMA